MDKNGAEFNQGWSHHLYNLITSMRKDMPATSQWDSDEPAASSFPGLSIPNTDFEELQKLQDPIEVVSKKRRRNDVLELFGIYDGTGMIWWFYHEKYWF